MDILTKINVFQSILRANLFALKRPLACHFSITNRCPWKCAYCGFPNMHEKECSTAEVLKIIDDLARMGNKRLHLVGGEPALRDDLGKIVERAKKHNLFVTMATTGFNFRKIIENIHDIDIFFLSFDGPEEIHDEQRGKGAYRVLWEAIDVIRQLNKPFWTTSVLTRKNIDYLDFILDTCRENNFMVNFHLLYFTGTDEYIDHSFHLNEVNKDLQVENARYKQAIEYLLKRKKTDMGHIIASSEAYLKALLGWGDLSEVYRKEGSSYYKCWAGKLYCYIDANGDVFPCGDVMGRIKPMNSIEIGFEQAFHMLPSLPCESCIVACFNELNLMFSLNMGSILNWVMKL